MPRSPSSRIDLVAEHTRRVAVKKQGRIVCTPCKGHDRPRQQDEWVTSSGWDEGKLAEARVPKCLMANNANGSSPSITSNVSSLNGLGGECRDIIWKIRAGKASKHCFFGWVLRPEHAPIWNRSLRAKLIGIFRQTSKC